MLNKQWHLKDYVLVQYAQVNEINLRNISKIIKQMSSWSCEKKLSKLKHILIIGTQTRCTLSLWPTILSFSVQRLGISPLLPQTPLIRLLDDPPIQDLIMVAIKLINTGERNVNESLIADIAHHGEMIFWLLFIECRLESKLQSSEVMPFSFCYIKISQWQFR